MESNVHKRIEYFSDYMQSQIKEINCIQGHSDYLLNYKRILLITLLDSLSKSINPESKRNHKRVTEFVRNFSEWKECDRISLIHLIKILEYSNDPSTLPLKEFCRKKYHSWVFGSVIYIDEDPSYEEISSFWPNNDIIFIDHKKQKISLDELRHVELFYNLRNSLIHEFHSPGKLSGDFSIFRNLPYYSGLIDELDISGKIHKRSWELQYPLLFISQIVETCLKNALVYFQEHNIDPYSQYTFGSYWIDGF